MIKCLQPEFRAHKGSSLPYRKRRKRHKDKKLESLRTLKSSYLYERLNPPIPADKPSRSVFIRMQV